MNFHLLSLTAIVLPLVVAATDSPDRENANLRGRRLFWQVVIPKFVTSAKEKIQPVQRIEDVVTGDMRRTAPVQWVGSIFDPSTGPTYNAPPGTTEV